jgi:hypothetical protein
MPLQRRRWCRRRTNERAILAGAQRRCQYAGYHLRPAQWGSVRGQRHPINRLDAAALALLNFYPQPNFPGSSRYNYQAPIVGISNQTNINSRVSETINAKNQVSGNFAWQSSNSSTPNLFNFIDTTKMTGINTGVQWNYHITTRLISNLRYNFSRSATNLTPFFANSENVSADGGILGNDQAAQFWGPPSLRFRAAFTGCATATTRSITTTRIKPARA